MIALAAVVAVLTVLASWLGRRRLRSEDRARRVLCTHYLFVPKAEPGLRHACAVLGVDLVVSSQMVPTDKAYLARKYDLMRVGRLDYGHLTRSTPDYAPQMALASLRTMSMVQRPSSMLIVTGV